METSATDIEPMISEGTWKDVTWPDSWSASTMVRTWVVSDACTHMYVACLMSAPLWVGQLLWPHPQHMPSHSARFGVHSTMCLCRLYTYYISIRIWDGMR